MRSLLTSAAAALTVAVASAGCVASLLDVPGESHLAFACRVLDPDAPQVVIQMWRGDGVTMDLLGPAARLAAALANVTDRSPAAFTLGVRDGPDAPTGGWNRTTLLEWSLDRPPLAAGAPVLHVVWLADFTDTGARLGPGAVAVSQSAAGAVAARVGRSITEVAAVLAMHYVGHALGVVNDGIPVQDPNLQVREGPPNHEPDPRSVLHAGWHQAATAVWPPNATLLYSDGVRGDLRAAAGPGGVCA